MSDSLSIRTKGISECHPNLCQVCDNRRGGRPRKRPRKDAGNGGAASFPSYSCLLMHTPWETSGDDSRLGSPWTLGEAVVEFPASA